MTSISRGRGDGLYVQSFDSIADVVETLLAQITHNIYCQRKPESRFARYSATRTTYVAVILPPFYEPDTPLLLCGTKEHIQSAYSEHGRLFLSTRVQATMGNNKKAERYIPWYCQNTSLATNLGKVLSVTECTTMAKTGRYKSSKSCLIQ